MSEEPETVSTTPSPLLSPDEIARKSFPAARRGVDGEAVHTFLARVAAELRETLERDAQPEPSVALAARLHQVPSGRPFASFSHGYTTVGVKAG